MLTDKNEIVCTLPEFNEYRRDLHRVRREQEKEGERLQVVDDLNAQRIKIAGKVAEKIDEKSDKFHRMYGICNCSLPSSTEEVEGICKCRYEKFKFIDELDKQIIKQNSQDGKREKSQQNYAESSSEAVVLSDTRRNSIKNPCKYENIADYILKRKREIEDEKRSK